MIIDMGYWNKIIKKILYIIFIFFMVFIVLKLACFFMPFLIALIIANLIDPIIKFISKKTKLVRKASAIISLILIFAILIGVIILISVAIISETSNLLKDFSSFGNNVFNGVEEISNFLKLENFNVSPEVKNIINDATNGVVSHMLEYFKNFLIGILNMII